LIHTFIYVFLISGHLEEHLAPSMEVTPLLNVESTTPLVCTPKAIVNIFKVLIAFFF
jgi:hypothetical protein